MAGGMAARYRSGYLVPGGVEHSLTQKPGDRETPSPGSSPHPSVPSCTLAREAWRHPIMPMVEFPSPHPHMPIMTSWKPTPREPAKTKAELREMLAEAVRNTQPQTKPLPKAKKGRSRMAAG